MKRFIALLSLLVLFFVAQSELQSQEVNYFYTPDGTCCATVTCNVPNATEFRVLGLYGWQTWNPPVDEITFCQPYSQPGNYTIQFRDASGVLIDTQFFTFEDCDDITVVRYYSTPNGTCCAAVSFNVPDAVKFEVLSHFGSQTWNPPVDEIIFCQPYSQPGNYTIHFKDANDNLVATKFFTLEDCVDKCDCSDGPNGLSNIFSASSDLNGLTVWWNTDEDHPCWAAIQMIGISTNYQSFIIADTPEEVAALNGTGASYPNTGPIGPLPILCPKIMITLDDGTICEYIICPGPTKESVHAVVAKTKVYPNPTSDLAKVAFTLDEEAFVKIDLYDQNGNVVANIDKAIYSSGQNVIDINTAKFASGSYYVTLTLDGETISIPLTIAK